MIPGSVASARRRCSSRSGIRMSCSAAASSRAICVRRSTIWVRHLEHIVRRFIFVLALAIDAPPPRLSLATKCKLEEARHFTSPQRLIVLAPTPLLIPDKGPVRSSRPLFGGLLDLLRIGPRSVSVRSRRLARRIEALRHALCHADDRANSVARAIARRLVDVFRPISKIRPQRWRVKRGQHARIHVCRR